jgi:site-specific recombinase XerD
VFDQWWASVRFDRFAVGVLALRAQNSFVRDFVAYQVLPTVSEKLCELTGAPVTVEWRVDPTIDAPEITGARWSGGEGVPLGMPEAPSESSSTPAPAAPAPAAPPAPRVDFLAAACGRCGADRGEPCVNAKGAPCAPHRARREAALRAEARLEETPPAPSLTSMSSTRPTRTSPPATSTSSSTTTKPLGVNDERPTSATSSTRPRRTSAAEMSSSTLASPTPVTSTSPALVTCACGASVLRLSVPGEPVLLLEAELGPEFDLGDAMGGAYGPGSWVTHAERHYPQHMCPETQATRTSRPAPARALTDEEVLHGVQDWRSVVELARALHADPAEIQDVLGKLYVARRVQKRRQHGGTERYRAEQLAAEVTRAGAPDPAKGPERATPAAATPHASSLDAVIASLSGTGTTGADLERTLTSEVISRISDAYLGRSRSREDVAIELALAPTAVDQATALLFCRGALVMVRNAGGVERYHRGLGAGAPLDAASDRPRERVAPPTARGEPAEYELICGCGYAARTAATPDAMAALHAQRCPKCGESWAPSGAAAPIETASVAPAPPAPPAPIDHVDAPAPSRTSTEPASVQGQPLEIAPAASEPVSDAAAADGGAELASAPVQFGEEYSSVSTGSASVDEEPLPLDGTLLDAVAPERVSVVGAGDATELVSVPVSGAAEQLDHAAVPVEVLVATASATDPAPLDGARAETLETSGDDLHPGLRRVREGAEGERELLARHGGDGTTADADAAAWVFELVPGEAPGQTGGHGARGGDAPPSAPVAAPEAHEQGGAGVATPSTIESVTTLLEDQQIDLAPAEIASLLAGLPASARAELADLERLSRVYEDAATATNTRRVYRSQFGQFVAWCKARGGLSALPAHAEVLRLYLCALARDGKALSTIEVALAAIGMAHRMLHHEAPRSERLRTTLRGLRRRLGPLATQAAAIPMEMLRQIVSAPRADTPRPIVLRDAALLLVTYFAGLRRSEAAGLNREWARREPDGYLLRLGATKGDQEGTDDPPTGLPPQTDPALCPVRALDAWIEARSAWASGPQLSPARGALFFALRQPQPGQARLLVGQRLAPEDVHRILRRRAKAAGVQADLSAHGLRAGVYTEAARRGASLVEIQRHARHKDLETTLRYVRRADALGPGNPTRGLAC